MKQNKHKKFLVFAPSYDEMSGGIVVLHKLCSILNDLGHECYLYPYFENYELNKNNCIFTVFRFIKSTFSFWTKRYKTNPEFNTPLYKKNTSHTTHEDWIVVYPEDVFGNPLGANNVVRWLLHQPGFHTGKVYYGKNELYFKFNNAIHDFTFTGSITSNKYLKVIHYPLEHYNTKNVASNRSGTAYCLRKGKNKAIQHDITDSILIDGKPHKEVAEIFKKVETFISYDTLTAYSLFAVLCGCDSVVIPDEGTPKEDWYPDPIDRYGIAYGFSERDEARKTAHLVLPHVKNEEERSVENIKTFVEEVEKYFSNPRQDSG